MAPWQVSKEPRLGSGWTPLRMSTVLPSRFSLGGGRLAFPPEVAAGEVGAELSLAELLGQVCWGSRNRVPLLPPHTLSWVCLELCWVCGPMALSPPGCRGPHFQKEMMCSRCREGSWGGSLSVPGCYETVGNVGFSFLFYGSLYRPIIYIIILRDK